MLGSCGRNVGSYPAGDEPRADEREPPRKRRFRTAGSPLPRPRQRAADEPESVDRGQRPEAGVAGVDSPRGERQLGDVEEASGEEHRPGRHDHRPDHAISARAAIPSLASRRRPGRGAYLSSTGGAAPKRNRVRTTADTANVAALPKRISRGP